MRGRWHWGIPAVGVLCLLAPLILTDRSFSNDWSNHYWLIWTQGLNIANLGEPSLYLQSNLGVFYPYYAFYGGSFYAAAGFLSELIDPKVAVIGVYLFALSSAYLGWTWLARLAGVRGWRAQLPGMLAITAPIAVTNLYGRGDIPEVVATAMLPLVAAAAISFVREPRARLRDAAAYVLGIVVLTGTHTLTLVWGTVFLALAALLFLACYWQTAKQRARRLLGLLGLAALGACVNAWILGPLILYHGRLIETDPDPISATAYTDPSRLFSIFREAADPYPVFKADIDAALPVLALVWGIVVVALAWRLLDGRRRGLLLGLGALLAGLVALILSPSSIESLPELLTYIQFPYRIVTYADLCVVGIVTLALAALERAGARGRAAAYALAAVALFNLVLAVVQTSQVRSWLGDREEALTYSTTPPRTWYATLQFADSSAPLVAPTLQRQLLFQVTRDGIQDRYRVVYPPGPAGTVQTNIATGPYLVDLEGAEPVGRGPYGQMVVRLPASPHNPRVVEVSAGSGSAPAISRWVSLAAIAACAFGAGAVALRRRGSGPVRG
jgi:hypothetical protein